LKYPEFPLHNNECRTGGEAQIIKEMLVSIQLQEEDTKASDSFSTIVHTAKKLGVSVL